jgi:hypothetical protein
VASGSQAIAGEHQVPGPFKKSGSGDIGPNPAIRTTGAVGPRAYAGRLIGLDTTLLVLSQQFEPVCAVDKEAVEKDLQSREKILLARQL